MPLGLTLMTLYGGRSARREPLEILILGGLPALLFGRIVAHEAMHAWLAQEGVSTLPAIEEEGLCELAAYEWLGLRRGRLSRGLRGAAERNPAPVYGDGFRLVHRAGGAGPIRLSAGRFTRRT